MGMCKFVPSSINFVLIAIITVMTYQHKLNPWAVFRLQANLRHLCVARFHKRSDAEHYEALLRRVNNKVNYKVVFAND
jgi:hypothetical protein